ncbi:MAG: SgcJ/EcaC family oxidoreductase [Gemmatimonadota bacterium]
MPRHLSFAQVALWLCVAACAQPAKAPETPVDLVALKTSIQAREKEWSAAFLARNTAGIANLYTEDAVQLQPVASDDHRGRDGITKATQAQFDSLLTRVATREDITEEIILAGNYVVEVGRYAFLGTNKLNRPVSGSGRYLVVWRKDADGAWRMLRDIGSGAR